MSRKTWVVFAAFQVIGVALFAYCSRFEAGASAVCEVLWIPTMVLLFPGWLLGYAAVALDLEGQLGRPYAAPFLASVVVVNAVCWTLAAVLIRKVLRRYRTRQSQRDGLR